MDSSYSLFFLVILCVPDLCGASKYGEDWVDPDPLSKINRNRSLEPEAKEARNPFQNSEGCMKIEKTSVIKRKLNRCSQLLTNCSKLLHDLKHNVSSLVPPKESSLDDSVQKPDCVQEKLYMKRFINIFLKVSKLNEDMPQTLDTHLYITVTLDQLKVLQQFSKGSQDVTLQELEHVLSSVLLSSKPDLFFEDYIPWSGVAAFFPSKEVLVALVVGCLPLLLIWKVLNGHSVIRVMTMFVALLILISYSVTYCRMYKQAEIKQYAVMKAKGDVPAECRPPSEQTWWNSIKNLFSGDRSGECQKYFEAGMLDPFLEVTPTLVLSEMVAEFFLHPSGMLGSAIAKYSNNLLGGLPFGLNFVVLIASFVLVAAIIIASCGGVIRLPWYMGGLELVGPRPQQNIIARELLGQRPQEMITAESQKSQVTELVEQSSGSSALNEAAISNLMHKADSTDTGLVIMNVTGIRKLLSAGNTTVVHGDIIEETRRSSPEKKCICASEQSGHFRSSDVTLVSDCCVESQLRSRAVLEGEMVTVESGCLHQPLREDQTEDLQLKMRAATYISRDKHVEIQRTEVVKKYTEPVQQKDETEESASADKDALSDCRAASTVDSCKVRESDVEEEGNKRRSSSIDVSDEEVGFVKLW